MQNLVNKYTPTDVESTDDEGVVAIEYVLVAGIVAAGIATVALTGVWQKMLDKLNALF